MKLVTYHGTIWEKPLLPTLKQLESGIVFDNISAGHNELGAFFVSENQSVCEFFGERKVFDEENQIQAVLKLDMETEKVVELTLERMGFVTYDNQSYDYTDNESRQELYSRVRKDFDALVVKGDYLGEDDEPGSDIAVFNPSVVKTTAVRLKCGSRWTEFLTKEAAIAKFLAWGKIRILDCDSAGQMCFG